MKPFLTIALVIGTLCSIISFGTTSQLVYRVNRFEETNSVDSGSSSSEDNDDASLFSDNEDQDNIKKNAYRPIVYWHGMGMTMAE